MMVKPFVLDYKRPPTILRFQESNAEFRGIMGPVGSGKSTGCCIEMFRRALLQEPNREGVRDTRWAVVRNTYAQLKSTTIPTWQAWFPPSRCPIVEDAPIRGRMVERLGDGTTLRMTLWFLALDRPEHRDKVMSLEVTGAYVNEARRIPLEIINALSGRVGRYPAAKDGGVTWRGIIADTNPPDMKHWWYRFAEEECPEGWEFFRQPAALLRKQGRFVPNPDAENIEHLDGGFSYYVRQVRGATEEYINVHVLGNYGTSFEGRAVYEQSWNDQVHVSKTALPALKGLPVHIGMDFGLTPAAVAGQLSSTGRALLQKEWVSENMGVRQFCEQVLIPGLNESYPGRPRSEFLVWGDPAGKQRSQADSDFSAFSVLAEFGFRVQEAGSNDFLPRKTAVETMLLRMAGGEAALQLDPEGCPTLREAFNGGYCYRRVAASGAYQERPEKNEFSHVSDACQYLMQGMTGGGKKAEKVTAPAMPDRSRALFG